MSYEDGWIVFDTDMDKLLAILQNNAVLCGLKVVPQTPAAMGITVQQGECLIQGKHFEFSDTNVALDAADPTLPRKDLIMVNADGTITKTTGTTSSASPSGETGPKTAKPIPPNHPKFSVTDELGGVVLGEVWVAAGVTSVAAADIADRRVRLIRDRFTVIPVARTYAGITESFNFVDPGSTIYTGTQIVASRQEMYVIGGRAGNPSGNRVATNRRISFTTQRDLTKEDFNLKMLGFVDSRQACPESGDAGFSGFVNDQIFWGLYYPTGATGHYAYDPSTNGWTAKSKSGVTYRWDNHCHRSVYNDLIWVCGGGNNSTIYKNMDTYDYSTNSWTTKASCSNNHMKPCTGINRKYFYIAGSGYTSYNKNLEVYDMDGNTWADKGNCPFDPPDILYDGAIFPYGENVLIIGGRASPVMEYDLANDKWYRRENKGCAEFETAQKYKGKIIMVCGFGASQGAEATYKIYEP